MNRFEEVKSRYIIFQEEFSKNIRDNFGESIHNEGLIILDRHINILCNHEMVVDIESSKVNNLLLEARSVLPDLGV